MKPIDANRVLAALVEAQLHNRGHFPVKVVLDKKEYLVASARFNQNSGNVELSIKG